MNFAYRYGAYISYDTFTLKWFRSSLPTLSHELFRKKLHNMLQKLHLTSP